MRFKTAALRARDQGERLISRDSGRTQFDVIKYQPDLLEEEDLFSDDWEIEYE
jgi:hypothetical protein